MAETEHSRLPFFLADSLLKQISAFRQEIDGVLRNRDIEYVHRMRVASRRLRTRLGVFEKQLPAKKVGSWQKQARKVTRALGAARDTDVQVKFVKRFLKETTVPETRPGIRRLLLRLRQKRAALQGGVEKAIDRLKEGGAMDDMEGCLRQIRVRARLSGRDEGDGPLYMLAKEEVGNRLEEMLGWELYVNQPGKRDELHSMRISAKHLRYAMETFAPAFAGGFAEQIPAVKKVQELLGDLHDCDVWAESLPKFMEEERGRALDYSGHEKGMEKVEPGIAALRKDRSDHRRRVYREFVRFWKETQEGGLWRNLMKTLEERAAPPAIEDNQQPAPAAIEGSNA